jgi:hypothetical protein
MKIHLFVLAALVSCSLLQSCSGKASSSLPHFPAYKIIFDKFYSKYGNPIGEYIEFAKKPTGYYVVEKDASLKLIKEHLFWSAETKQFKNLPGLFTEAYTPDNAPMGDYYSRNYSFDHALYFNYPEAADESIKALEDIDDKNDTLYEMLGRAYSTKCDQFSGGRQGQGNSMKDTKMSGEEAEKFIAAGKKMIEAYKQVMQLNPNYETLIGKIRTQHAHQHVYLWMELTVSGHPDLAKQFLVNDIYDDLVLNFAKNMLTSCPPNSILFTHGDTDTYPLMYLQQAQNFRKDVSIVNCSLLNAPPYLEWYVKTNNIEIDLSIDDYKSTLTDYILLDRQSENKEPVQLQEFINKLKTPAESNLIIKTGTSDVLRFPSNVFELTVSGKHIDSFDSARKMASQHVFTIDRNYLMRSDIFELDVMATNAWKRPVAFASSGETNVTAFTKNFMDSYGLVVMMSPFEENSNAGKSAVNTDRLYDLLMNKYVYGIKYNKGYESNGLVTNYFILFTDLSSALIPQDKEKAVICLTRIEKEIPFLTHPEETEGLVLTDGVLWASVNNMGKASTAFEKGLNEIERKLKQDLDNNERERLVNMIYYALSNAVQYNLEDVKKKAEALRERYKRE